MSTQKAANLRIRGVKAENTKRIRLVALRLDDDGRLITIAGNNGEGKTSLFDAMSMTLQGRAARPVEHPVRIGQETGSCELDLGELVVRRAWAKHGEETGVVVKQRLANGRLSTMGSPQAILDELISHNMLEPMRYVRLPGKQRVEELRRHLDLGIDLEALNLERKSLFDERTGINRDLRTLDGQDVEAPAGGTEEEISITALTEQMRQAQERNRETERLQQQVAKLRGDKAELVGLIERLEAKLTAARADLQTVGSELAAAEKAHDARTVESIESVQREIEQADVTNRGIRERNATRKRSADTLARREELLRESARLTAAVDAIDKRKADALSKAKVPVKGLSFDGEDVTLNDVPFADLSASEQIRVALAIGMLAQPRLKVAFIRDASLLDVESRRKLLAWAEANDAQVWIEVVGDGGEGAVVIDDGMVVGAEVPAVAAGGA